MIQVIIIDDHKILVEGLVKLISESKIARVSDVGFDAKSCRRLLKTGLPDVLMLDINLPDANGVELCKELKELYPSLKILALTSYNEYSVVKRMLENGASGYILKNAMYEELTEAIQTVARGETFLCHEVDLQLKKQSNTAIWITPREQELLKLIVEGYTNPEIAEKIFLSPETIKGYRKNLLFKLDARNTAMLVKIALEQKLI
jgi:DNA-binding NarL/FixJ family response regulator